MGATVRKRAVSFPCDLAHWTKKGTIYSSISLWRLCLPPLPSRTAAHTAALPESASGQSGFLRADEGTGVEAADEINHLLRASLQAFGKSSQDVGTRNGAATKNTAYLLPEDGRSVQGRSLGLKMLLEQGEQFPKGKRKRKRKRGRGREREREKESEQERERERQREGEGEGARKKEEEEEEEDEGNKIEVVRWPILWPNWASNKFFRAVRWQDFLAYLGFN